MKSVGATLFASALALVAGCSSGSSDAPRADESAQRTDSLRAPSVPENDACAGVRCAAGTECVVDAGAATCAETGINPCAAALCLAGSTCEVVDGQPVCTPSDASGCAAVSCLEGTTCEVIDGEPVCTPIPSAGPFCGGFGGFACPGSGTCVDDATDSCDPENGGADCGGVCECNVRALCIQGFVFDESPDVCACVESPELDPCAVVRCAAGTECVVVDGSASCEPTESPCALVDCFPGNICQVVEGEAVCVPVEGHDCN